MNKLIVVLLALFGISTQLQAEWKVAEDTWLVDNQPVAMRMIDKYNEYCEQYQCCPYMRPGSLVRYDFMGFEKDYFEDEDVCLRYLLFKVTFEDQKYAVSFEFCEDKKTGEITVNPHSSTDIKVDGTDILAPCFIKDIIHETKNRFPDTKISSLLNGHYGLVFRPMHKTGSYTVVRMEIIDLLHADEYGMENTEPVRMNVIFITSSTGKTDFTVLRE